ncbi:MAG: VCBS repeat-containing protein [Firmicutes bacterium]|nr:VCBS repeat-containing protein [Bacillota bacterium]
MPVRDVNILGYIKDIIPEGAQIQFVFHEDFNGDGKDEAVIVYSNSVKSHTYTYVLYAEMLNNSFKHHWLISETTQKDYHIHTIIDAYAVDLTGDKRPELVLVFGKARTTFLCIFHWDQGLPKFSYVTEEFYHGLVDVIDEDNDGVYEIILVEETLGEEQEIISSGGYLPHVCVGHIFKWDGQTYSRNPYQIKTKDTASFNTAVKFLLSLWKEDYENAYKLVYLPTFLGLENLGQNTMEVFRALVDHSIKPALMKNLETGLLEVGPYLSFYNTSFIGRKYDLNISFANDKGLVKVSSIVVNPKGPKDVVQMFFDAIEQGQTESALSFCVPDYKQDNIIQLIESHKHDTFKGGVLKTYYKKEDANKAIMYTCYASLPDGYYTYTPPNRVTCLVLEKFDDNWLLKYIKYLGDILPTEIKWEQYYDYKPEYGDGIYPVYQLNFEKPTYIVIQTHSSDIRYEHNGQFSVPDCKALRITNIFNGVDLSIYQLSDKEDKKGFISTDAQKVYICKISEIAYIIHIIVREAKSY